ncbi:MAG: GTP-binding protein, partial [Gammaproteobacteria bacterium]
MLPVVAIVGRPNVGKSTLFNQLTRTREALVHNEAGLTRDRQYGMVRHGERPYVVIDTGGIATHPDRIGELISQQAFIAMDEADVIVLLLDGRDGLTPEDESIAAKVRTLGQPILAVVNKTDGINPDTAIVDFHRLGLGEPLPIAAAQARGMRTLSELLLEHFPAAPDNSEEQQDSASEDYRTKVAIVGRPNVGKSTLVNRLVGEERVVAHDMPGTTRDSIYVPFERGKSTYTLIDTAGVRRRARVSETAEKFSIIKTLQAIEAANVVVLMLDAQLSVAEQDLRLLGHVLDAGRALVIAINKWDAADQDMRDHVESECDRRLRFIEFASRKTISAETGDGLGGLMLAVDQAWQASIRKLPTPELTRVLANATEKHPPPLSKGRRVKLRYAHQGGSNPPRIIIHGSQTDAVSANYERYLMRIFRDVFNLHGTPVKIEFRTGDNPFKDRKNTLTKRQVDKR